MSLDDWEVHRRNTETGECSCGADARSNDRWIAHLAAVVDEEFKKNGKAKN